MTRDTYAVDTNDVPLLNEGIKATARHLSASQSLLEDEARAWEDGMLEDLKRQRDNLVSMREMFDRRDRYARNNIPQLERRIETNERRLQDLRAKPQGTVKPGDIEKVEESIFKVCIILRALLEYFADSFGRTKSRLCNNTRAGYSSKSASATSWSISNRPNITSAGCIRTGVKSESSIPSCRLTIGGHWVTRSKGCRWETERDRPAMRDEGFIVPNIAFFHLCLGCLLFIIICVCRCFTVVRLAEDIVSVYYHLMQDVCVFSDILCDQSMRTG